MILKAATIKINSKLKHNISLNFKSAENDLLRSNKVNK